MAVTEAPLPRRLEGLTAVVTGAGHGIGRAYARRLGLEGARIVVADIDGVAAEQVAKDMQAEQIDCLAAATDISNPTDVKAMVSEALTRFGRIDILVNNAAVFKTVPLGPGRIDELDSAHFERVLKVNVVGVFLCCQAVVPDMRKRQYGKIINISSVLAMVAPPRRGGGSISYASSKAAVLGMTKAMAREVGADGIRVNCIAPGVTFSDDTYDAETLAAEARRPQIDERSVKAVETPEDLVGTVAFLASHDSDFITGQTIVVDGGFLMH